MRLVDIGIGLIDLVDRDDEGNIRFADLGQRFERLRLHTVVGRNHKDRDVGHIGAACTNSRECRVPGSIDESDPFLCTVLLALHLVRGHVLRDTTGFTGDNIGFANEIEKRRLTVVDMPHHHNDGRALYRLRSLLCHRLLSYRSRSGVFARVYLMRYRTTIAPSYQC